MRKLATWIILPTVLLAAYAGYRFAGSELGERPSFETRISQVLLDRVSLSIAAGVRFDDRLESLFVLPIAGDPQGNLRSAIQRRLAEKGFVGIEEEASRVARRIGELGNDGEDASPWWKRLNSLLEPDPGDVVSPEEAINFGRRAEVSSVLLAAIETEGLDEMEHVLSVEAQILDIEKGGAILPPATHSASIKKSWLSPTYVSIRLRGASPWPRLVAGLGFVLILPLALIVWVRRALARESNASNSVLLAGLTLLDLFMIWTLLGFEATTATAAIAMITGGFLALAYNFLFCSWCEELMH